MSQLGSLVEGEVVVGQECVRDDLDAFERGWWETLKDRDSWIKGTSPKCKHTYSYNTIEYKPLKSVVMGRINNKTSLV